ncbi:MAG: glycyl-radical enzyme activating protein [Propionibacteriaceae bacterium]|nr:glycyl-radical enzyme activating protein [Propionibacteriaceae bacterium]
MGATTGRIFDIQKFSLHDGPGIRTVVFLKGCPMDCAWCSNPNSRELRVLQMRDAENPDVLLPDSHDRTVADVVRTCLQDLPFYEESGGGVTLSGGEALVQHRFATRLLGALAAEGVHTAVETTGYASPEVFGKVRDASDLLIIDVKHHDAAQHRRWTGVDNTLPLRNLATALAAGGPVLVRIPVIPGVNDSLDDAAAFARLLAPLGLAEVQLLPFHQFGERKYELLDWQYPMHGVPALHAEDLAEFGQVLTDQGVRAFT